MSVEDNETELTASEKIGDAGRVVELLEKLGVEGGEKEEVLERMEKSLRATGKWKQLTTLLHFRVTLPQESGGGLW